MFKYSPTSDTSGTSKLCHLLSTDNMLLLEDITPEKLANTFGERKIKFYEWERGYTDPEWMFKTDSGEVVGFGFRWGNVRLRGRNLSQETANSFIKSALSMINITLSRS